MCISKKRWEDMEKRMTDIEKQVQQQPLEIFSILCGHWHKQMTKSGGTNYSSFQSHEMSKQCSKK